MKLGAHVQKPGILHTKVQRNETRLTTKRGGGWGRSY